MSTNRDASHEKDSAASAAPNAVPPQVVLYQLATGHYLSRALLLAVKLGIAELLKNGPKHYQELATATGTHEPSLKRVMRLLASAGVFAEGEDGQFTLTPVGECLQSGVPGSSRAMVGLFASDRIQECWKHLEYCVRTGNPEFRGRGVSNIFEDPSRTPEDEANFDAAMADITRYTAIAVAAAYDFAGFRTLVDVGGGNGTLLAGILKANPSVHGIVYDQPAAVQRAAILINENQLADRCRAIGGDFFKEVPAGGDAYLLKHVIHDWDDTRAVAILRNCHRVMQPEGKLLIIEAVYPPQIDQSIESRGAATNDVNMLVMTGGRQRSESEFRALYQAAGFTLTRIVPTGVRFAIIEGLPA